MKAGLMLGVNPKSKREKNDYYATDPYAIDKVIETFKAIGVNNNIWECACGEGHLSKRLLQYGYNVYSSDLIDRGYGETENFLTSEKSWDGDIITNPPFKEAHKFVYKAIELLKENKLCILLLKVQFLETKERAKLFKNCGLKYLIVNSERICCAMNGEFEKYFKKGKNGEYRGGTQLYCWYVFQKGYEGEPLIKFI